MPHRTRCVLRAACVTPLLLPLGACSKAMTVSGKVIAGEVSMVGVVDPADPRLKTDGLASVEVSARGTGGRADRLLAETRSGKSGDFTLRIDDQDATSSALEFRAHLAGFADARQPMDLPPGNRRVLVVLKPLSTGSPPR